MTTITDTYPTAQNLYTDIQDFLSTFDVIVSDWDEFIYEFISNKYDNRFLEDDHWYNENETDIKDNLRDELLEMFGVA